MDYQNYHHHQNPTTDLFTEEPLVKANFGSRFAATLIDGLILLVPNLIYFFIFPETISDLAQILTAWIYFASMESGPRQATLGKTVMEIKVVGSNGERLSFGRATGRHFGKFISALILLIGYLMMLWDEKQQTLHDKMVNAFVVKA